MINTRVRVLLLLRMERSMWVVGEIINGTDWVLILKQMAQLRRKECGKMISSFPKQGKGNDF